MKQNEQFWPFLGVKLGAIIFDEPSESRVYRNSCWALQFRHGNALSDTACRHWNINLIKSRIIYQAYHISINDLLNFTVTLKSHNIDTVTFIDEILTVNSILLLHLPSTF